MNPFKKALALLFLTAACGSTGPYVWVSSVPQAPAAIEPLRVGDRVQVVVHGQDAMSGEFEIRPGGEVVLPVAGRLIGAGMMPDALAVAVRDRLRGMLAEPVVTVVIAVRRPMGISVIGEVRTPGRYELRDSEGVVDALARAGGLTPFADDDAVFVVRRGSSGPRVRFRYSDLAAGDASSVRYQLKDGDVVVVE